MGEVRRPDEERKARVKNILKKTTRIGSDKICPSLSNTYGLIHCLDECEWNDGEGCAIWRIVKALEGLERYIEAINRNMVRER